MRFTFDSHEIKRICEEQEKGIRDLGNCAARDLRRYLTDIDASQNVAEFLLTATAKIVDNVLVIDLGREFVLEAVKNPSKEEIPLEQANCIKFTRIYKR